MKPYPLYHIFLRCRVLCFHFVLCILTLTVSAQQRYAENWCFFYFHKLNFSTGVPVLTDPSSLTGWGEGCATISDKNTGELLFYTDGVTVYDRNNNVMVNGTGLVGNTSSTQSSLIIPFPSDTSKYYIFTTGEDAGSGFTGLAYSVVDMTLNNSLGAVTAVKNITLNNVAAEKLTATKLCNDEYWLLCTNQYNNEFYSYRISSSGISTAVISAAGTTNHVPRCAGQMKFSPNGQKIAKAYYYNYLFNNPSQTYPIAELYDFDLNTGYVSNAIALNIPGAQKGYGTEFSPNNNFVYFDMFGLDISGNGHVCVYQFDVSNYNSTAINNSCTAVYCGTVNRIRSMQLGTDGKIYRLGLSNMDVINYPDLPGLNCNYVAGQMLVPSISSGLPNFVSSFLVASPVIPTLNLPDQSVCRNDTILIAAPAGFAGYNWSPGYNINTPNAASIQAWPAVDTSYILTATTNEGCSITDTMLVHVNTATSIDLGSDTSLCRYDSFILDAGPGFADYLWNTGEHSQSIVVNTAGVFDVTAIDNDGCKSKDSLEVLNIYELPVINLQHEASVCEGEHYLIDVTAADASYLWQDGSAYATYDVMLSGTYSVTVSINGCKSTDSIIVSYKDCHCELNIPNAITPNGDGINDKWVLSNATCFSQLDVYVYNRYGSLVYQQYNYKNDWQGTYRSKNLPDGTYYYVIKAKRNNKGDTIFKGNITLLR